MQKHRYCIYGIKNIVNGKYYVGIDSNYPNRFRVHKRELKQQIHCNKLLQRAWNKYGEDAFILELLEEYENKYILVKNEPSWIIKLDSRKNGYNLTDGGEGAPGYKQTEEHKRKIAEANKGKKVSEETKEKIREKVKLQIFRKGWKRTPENIEKMRECRKKLVEQGWKPHNKGKKMSEETRKKLSESAEGEKAWKSKLKNVDVIEIRKYMEENRSRFKSTRSMHIMLATKYKVSLSSIDQIHQRKTFKNI